MGRVERGRDGADRDIERGRDLPVVEVGVVAEVDDQPPLVGQRCDPGADEVCVGLAAVSPRAQFLAFRQGCRRVPLLLLRRVDDGPQTQASNGPSPRYEGRERMAAAKPS